MLVVNYDLAGRFVDKVIKQISAHKTVVKLFNDLIALHDGADGKTLGGTAVVLADYDILRNVNHTSGEVTRVGGTQSGIGKSLSCTTGGYEVFEYVQSLTIVGTDRYFYDRT